MMRRGDSLWSPVLFSYANDDGCGPARRPAPTMKVRCGDDGLWATTETSPYEIPAGLREGGVVPDRHGGLFYFEA